MFKPTRTDTLILLVTAFIVHGLLLLNDGVYWDGWMHVYWPIQENDWDTLYWTFDRWGYPIRAYQHWLVGHLPSLIFGHKLFTFLSIFLCALLVHHIGSKSGYLTRRESLFVALLSMVYPAYQVAFELIMMPYNLSYVFFLLGVLGMLHLRESSSWLLRIGTLAALVFSFWIYSFLPFYFGFLLLIFMLEWGSLPFRQAVLRFLWRWPDFILFPFIFWAALRVFFVQGNPAAENYYTPQLSTQYFYSAMSFLQNGVIAQVNAAFGLLIDSPIALLGCAAVLVWFYRDYETRPFSLRLVGFGVVLLGLGMLPYITLNFYPLEEGWETRHALLLGLPMAVLCVGLARLIPRKLSTVLLALLVIVFSLLTLHRSLGWQVRWIKDRSIVYDLQQQPEAQDISLFWVDDQHPLGNNVPYVRHEWTSIMRMAWGGDTRIGLPASYEPTSALYDPAMSARFEEEYSGDLNRQGCQAILEVRPGSGPNTFNNNLGLTFRYFVFKLIGGMDDYLNNLTTATVRRIAAPTALDCPIQAELLAAVDRETRLEDSPDVMAEHWRKINTVLYLESLLQAPESDYYAAGYPPLRGWLMENSQQEVIQKFGFDVDFYTLYWKVNP